MRKKLHRDEGGRGYLPGCDAFRYFPQPEHSLATTYRDSLACVFEQCSQRRDHVHALAALRELSTHGCVGSYELQLLLDLLLDNTAVSAAQHLDLMRTVIVPRCVQRRINGQGDDARREQMLGLFVEGYVARGYLEEAQELLQARMADSVYARTPLFESYAAAILCMKVIRGAHEATKLTAPGSAVKPVTTPSLMGGLALAPSLDEVIANPLLFAVSCRVVSELVAGNVNDGLQFEAKQALSDCRTRLRDAIQIQFSLHSREVTFSQGEAIGGRGDRAGSTSGLAPVPTKVFSLDLQTLYVALLHGLRSPADAAKSMDRVVAAAQQGSSVVAESACVTGTAASDIWCTARLQVRYHCMFERQNQRRARQDERIPGKVEVKCGKRLIQLLTQWVIAGSPDGDTEAVYCALLLYRLGHLGHALLLRRLMRALDVVVVDETATVGYRWALWRSVACLLGRLGPQLASVDAPGASGHRHNRQICALLVVGDGNRVDGHDGVGAHASQPCSSSVGESGVGSPDVGVSGTGTGVHELADTCREFHYWAVTAFCPSQFTDLSWGLTEPEVELLLGTLLGPEPRTLSDADAEAWRERIRGYAKLQGVLVGLGVDARRVGPVASRLGMAGN